MNDFAHPPAAPTAVTYTSASPEYTEFGWTVAIDRTAEEFSTLENADASGFALAGSGSAIVRTPALYVPGKQYVVTFQGTSWRSSGRATANKAGALTLIVPLGPPNPYQEYTLTASASGGTRSYTTRVGIVRSP